MTERLKVGKLVAEPGKKIQGYLEIENSDIKMPVTLINGSKSGKTVAITGGTHGGEYAGIETAIRLAKVLKPKEISGRVVIAHIVNVPAFEAKLQLYGPLDRKNLSSCYPGKAMGTVSEQIAYTITTELHDQADFYLDLHGGDLHEAILPFAMHPTQGNEEVIKISRKAAGIMGMPYVFGSTWTNAIGSAAQRGVPAVIGEIGQCGLWNEQEVEKYIKGVKNVLRYQGVLPGEVQDLGPVTYFQGWHELRAEQTGCWYPCIKPGDKVEKGEKVGEIRDYFAKILGEYYAPLKGVVLLVATSLAINKGDQIMCFI